MKKDIIILVGAILIGLSIRYVLGNYDIIENFFSTKIYSLKITNFEEVSSKKFKEITYNKNENLVFYLGMDSCPFCRDNINRIKNMKKISENKSFVFKYYDTSNISESEREYLKNTFGLKTVPALVIIKSNSKSNTLFGTEDILEEDYEKNFKKIFN